MKLILDVEKKFAMEALKSPLLYLLLAIFGAWSVYALGFTIYALAAFSLAALLILMSVVDLKHMILPDMFMIPFIVLAFLLSPLLGYGYLYALIGFAFGFGLFYLIHIIFYKVKGYHGLGFGDVKLLGGLGAMTSAFSLPIILILASFSALFAFAIRRVLCGQEGSEPMPFGPFLALGGWVTFLYGGILWHYFFTFREFVVTSIWGG